MLSTSLAGLVTPRQAWLLLIGFGYSLAEEKEKKDETEINELRLIINPSRLYL